MTLQFNPCDEEACGNVTIVNDSIMEEQVEEEFIVSLEGSNTDSRVRVSAQPSTVRITDDDGLFTILMLTVITLECFPCQV